MKKIALCFLLISAMIPVAAQDELLSIKQVVSLALKNDTTVIKSAQTLNSSLNEYKSLQAGKYPQLNFSTSYGVDYTSKKQDIGSYGIDEFEKYTLHSVTLGFSLDQLVPTYGTLSAGISNAMTVRKGRWNALETDPFFSQGPSFSLAFSQPVFFNGKIMDMELYGATFRKGEIGYQSAAEGNRISKNRAVYGAVSLLFDLVNLQNEIKKIEKAMELKKRAIDNLQGKFEKGLVAETQVWEMKVELGKEKEYLLANIYAIREKQGQLKLALGIAQDKSIMPDENLLQPELRFEEPGSPQELYRNNPAIRQTELAAEDARLNRIIDGANDASTLTLSFTVSPRYPFIRQLEPDATFEESFMDFADEMAGYDLGIKTELKVPLYNGAKWKHKVAADRATELSLQQEAAYQKSNLLQALRMLLLRRENLQERILLLEDNIKLKKKQAEVGRALVEVGQIAELDVIEIEIEYFVKENELEKAKMDLYLTTLDILSLMGRDLGEVIVG